MVSIRTVDPHHDDEFRAAYEAFSEGVRAGRTSPLMTSAEAMRTSLQDPNPRTDRMLLAAYDSDEHTKPLGVALLELPLRDNLHLAELEIAVLPRQRGRGIGSALFDHGVARAEAEHRSTFICEVYVEAGLELDDSPGGRFALSRGYRSVHEEDHLVLDLPAELPEAALSADYRVVSWRDHCPEELLTSYAAMRTTMERDTPQGELDVQPTQWDAERVRTSEGRMRKQGYTTLVSAAQHSGGELGGYTMILVPGGDQPDVYQDDTLVLAAHRGHRLGSVLKATNVALLQDGFPERERLHTWTAGTNRAMQAINRAFGFRVAETMHEVQRVEPKS